MTSKIPAIIILLIALVETAVVIVGLTTLGFGPPGTVPMLDWGSDMTYLLLWVLVPLIGSILAAVVVPRVLTPLFLVVKKIIRPGYHDGYVPMEVSSFGGRKMVMRLIYVYLLIVGLLTTLISLIDPQPFLPPDVYTSGIAPQYNISFIFCIAGLAAPISVALWSVGWALEDAALIHYKLPPKDSGKLYEIEPVSRSYSSYLKGFASFSTVLSLLVIFNYFIGISMPFDAVSVYLVPFHAMLATVPSYFLFGKMGSKWLRKNKRAVKQLEESDLDLYAE
jgi:hypothetical protein